MSAELTDVVVVVAIVLVPTLMPLCAVFPNFLPHVQALDGGYAWALWRPYSCCQRAGEIFLGSVDFAP